MDVSKVCLFIGGMLVALYAILNLVTTHISAKKIEAYEKTRPEDHLKWTEEDYINGLIILKKCRHKQMFLLSVTLITGLTLCAIGFAAHFYLK